MPNHFLSETFQSKTTWYDTRYNVAFLGAIPKVCHSENRDIEPPCHILPRPHQMNT